MAQTFRNLRIDLAQQYDMAGSFDKGVQNELTGKCNPLNIDQGPAWAPVQAVRSEGNTRSPRVAPLLRVKQVPGRHGEHGEIRAFPLDYPPVGIRTLHGIQVLI
jgi:hypothetical protein